MNKEFVFVTCFIVMLSLASIAGITHASTANPEKETPQASTSQGATSKNATAIFSNATLSAEFNNLVNSTNFKQTLAKWGTITKWSPSKNIQPPIKNQLVAQDFPYWYAYAYSVIAATYRETGYLYNPQNILGSSDVQYAQFHTELYRNPPYGDEAIELVQMQAAFTGDLYLTGYSGQYPTSDVFVFGSNDPNLPMEQWMGIGFAWFTQGSPQSVFVAHLTTQYSYLAIFCYAYNQAPWNQRNDAYIDCVTVIHDEQGGSPYISTSATADVAITPSCPSGGSTTINWQCADDYGVYYCYITSVVIDGVSHNPTDFGTANYGSITFNDYASHSVVVNSAPYYYPVTVYEWADGHYGEQVVNSWTQYQVAWEERDGPVYSHGSNLNGGGPINIYCDDGVTDPWDSTYCPFSYAYTDNWNGNGFGVYQYSNPISVWVYTWGNTENVYYQWTG